MKKSDFLYLSAYYMLYIYSVFMPDFVLKKTAQIVAFIVFKLNHKHRKIIDINLKICFPSLSEKEREKTALKIYENFAEFGIDFIKFKRYKKEKILEKISVENEKEFEEILKSKRALIITTAHFGNWELLPLFCALKYKPVSIVARALDSKIMDKIITQKRAQNDIELIDKFGAIRKMLAALKNGRILGILTDQDASLNESVRLKFFDKELNWLAGASVIAKKTEALLMPMFIYKDETNYKIKFFKALDSRDFSKEELCAYQAKCCEEMIKECPSQYFFFHKRFKSFDEKIYN